MRYLALYRAADFRDNHELRPGELDALRRWCGDMEARGITLTGSPLRPAQEAATVRARRVAGLTPAGEPGPLRIRSCWCQERGPRALGASIAAGPRTRGRLRSQSQG